MGTGWRRAFCTTVPRDPESTTISDKPQKHSSPSSASPSPGSCSKLGIFSGGSNPNTPRLLSNNQPPSSLSLRCRTTNGATSEPESPNLHCTTISTPKKTNTTTKSPKPKPGSNPFSPRSPLKLSLFKNSFKFRSSCGICLNSVKTGQGSAIYTAECTHAFHFPCIASHVRNQGSLVCPVCNVAWKDVPLLAVHKTNSEQNDGGDDNDPNVTNSNHRREVEEKKMVVVESSPASKAASPKHEIQPREYQPAQPKSEHYRSYDDDEPLLSPTAGARFNPIPEADENAEEEDEEEFQGFFVNPSIKSDDGSIKSITESRNVQVRLMPEAAIVSVGRGYETYAVALRVRAPPPRKSSNTAAHWDPQHRAPIDLVTVLDVGESMSGAKLHMLKRAMRLVISSLGSADRLSIVAFSGNSKRLMPLRRMTAHGQRSARRIVDRLMCGQGASMGDALRKATKVLEDRRERNPVASIMLLSDGQDDRVHGNASSSKRFPSGHATSSRFAHIEIPVHSSGFGKRGGCSHEPAEDAFAKCVGGLLSVEVQDLRVQVGFASGSAPAEIVGVYSCNTRPAVLSTGSVRLGDLYAEEERELLVELRVPSTALGSHHVMSVRCLYKDPATQEVVYGRDEALLVPRPHTFRSSSPKIQRLGNLFIATRAVAEARRLVEQNQINSAHHLLASSRALLMQSRSGSAEDFVRCLEAELAELHSMRQNQAAVEQQAMIQRQRGSPREMMVVVDENGEPLTPTSAWRAAEKLARVAMMKKSLNRVNDLHGFENARF